MQHALVSCYHSNPLDLLIISHDQSRSTSKLKCGHVCPSKCHKLVDHSQMACEISIQRVCSSGHTSWLPCHKATANPSCVHCNRELKRAQDEARREVERQDKRDKEKAAHDAKIDALDAEIARERAIQQDHRLELDRERARKQREQDLEDARAQTKLQSQPISNLFFPTSTPASTPAGAGPSNPPTSPTSPLLNPRQSLWSQMKATITAKPASPSSPSSPSNPPPPSPAEIEWKHQKQVEGATSSQIDSIISMIGLEKVKQQVLDLKAELEVSQRQGISLRSKNLNCALVGNPGTGMHDHFQFILPYWH